MASSHWEHFKIILCIDDVRARHLWTSMQRRCHSSVVFQQSASLKRSWSRERRNSIWLNTTQRGKAKGQNGKFKLFLLGTRPFFLCGSSSYVSMIKSLWKVSSPNISYISILAATVAPWLAFIPRALLSVAWKLKSSLQ